MTVVDSILDINSLLTEHARSDKLKELVSGNIGILKCVRGGLRMAESYRLEFDPRADYWYRPIVSRDVVYKKGRERQLARDDGGDSVGHIIADGL
jgi:hypothetical protein